MAMTSFRIPDELLNRLEKTAERLSRSKAWVINHALEHYVAEQEQQAQRLEETKLALADVEAGQVIEGEAVMAWLESWGDDDELDPPTL